MSERFLSPETIPVVASHASALKGSSAVIKRLMDILGALIGIPLGASLMIVTKVLIKLDSREPVFFIQERVGEPGSDSGCTTSSAGRR